MYRLGDAKNVVLIGHGTGCQALIELVNHAYVEQRVKAVVQVGGLHSLVRLDPQNEALRTWFKSCNRVYVPNSHPLLAEERLHRRLGGQLFTSQKAKVVDVLADVFPQIRTFVEDLVPATSGRKDKGKDKEIVLDLENDGASASVDADASGNGNGSGNGHMDLSA
jgi:histone deacetylase 6